MVLHKFHTLPILMPFSWIYSGVMALRNLAFDNDYLHETSFESRVAVIGVGNLVAGGAGKTPHIEYLIRLLKSEGVGPIAVLSRGYKRDGSGFVMAKPGISALKLGDESFQLYRKFFYHQLLQNQYRLHKFLWVRNA